MSTLPTRIAKMSPLQRDTLLKRIAAQAKSRPSATAASFGVMPRRADETVFPLSFEQRRLWFLDRLNPGSCAYNVVNYLPITGRPDVAAMRATLAEMLRRHEVFRTHFVEQDGEPVQVVLPLDSAPPVPLPIIDLSHLSESELEDSGVELVAAESRRPFDLACGPLLRSLLIVTPDRFFWAFAYHHLVTDWWSARIFYSEVMTLYECFKEGKPSPLPALPWQYADYAKAQRARLSEQVLAGHLAWWRARLGDPPPVLTLPTDRPRSGSAGAAAAKESVKLPAELAVTLRAFNKREGVTSFMTFMAALNALFHRYTGAGQIVLGSAGANRDLHEMQSVIGLFASTWIFPTDLSGRPSFRELVARVKQTCLDVYAHAELPFDYMVAALQPERDADRNPLFQVMFNLEKDFSIADVEEKRGSKDLSVEAKFDLFVQVVEMEEHFRVEFEYNTGLYERETMTRWLGHLTRLLIGALAEPERPLAELELLTPEERRQLLETWNDTAVSFPSETPVSRLFEAQAAQHPEQPAVIFHEAAGGVSTLSYGELNHAANVLAAELLRHGVTPGHKVAILSPSSVAFIAAELAILKAGAVFVPLDTEFPSERLRVLLTDAAAELVLVAPGQEERLAGFAIRTLPLRLDLLPAGASRGAADPAVAISAEAPAYVMYTSGSTGAPKGAVIPHRAISRLVWNRDELDLRPGDRVAHFANVAFDATIFEIWSPLLKGATVVGFTKEQVLQRPIFARCLAESRIDVAFMTTALFNGMARELPGAFATLRTLFFGGEVADPEAVRSVLNAGGPQNLVHIYGPTECTTFAVMARISEVAVGAEHVPIGRPIANTTCYILDDSRRPVPIGIDGELYIGGPGLALGYLNRPALTAERFVDHPFRPADGKLYRSGDLVRYLPDGSIRFVGRVDDQVKIRGFRVEPAEITHHIKALAGVQDATVVVRSERGDKRLVAYVVPQVGAALTPSSLRAALAVSLPDYMLPAAFVLMEALPLSSAGKVDRRALPIPDEDAVARSGAPAAPRTATEAWVASLFAEHLDLTTVGAADNFFTLGGHSLLATRLVSRLRVERGVELPLRSFFAAPTVAAVAAFIEANAGQPAAGQPILPQHRTPPLPLSFAQQRLWFLSQLEPDSHAYNMAEVVTLPADVDATALERAFTGLVSRHESLRTRFADNAGTPVQLIDPPARFHLTVTDFSSEPAALRRDRVLDYLNRCGRAPFDLAVGPLLFASLIHVSETEKLLFINLHHIIADGWSMRVFARELFALYADEHAALPPLPVQYADYAIWQRRHLQGEVLAKQLAYWRQQLADLPTVELPTDRSRPAVQSFAGELLTRRLPSELSGALKSWAATEGATLSQVLLAGLYVLLYRYTGQRDLVVGSPIANRNRSEVEHLIGLFVNSLVLRIAVDECAGLRTLLARVRETALMAYEHQDTPFEMLVDALQTERDLSRNPLFQILFDFHTDMGGLMVTGEGYEMAIDTAICDLSLSVFETEAGLVLGAQYATALFDRATVERLLGHYVRLLECGIAEPERPLAELELLTERERYQILVQWNDTSREYPRTTPVTRLIEQAAARTPDAAAAHLKDRTVSHAALNAAANRIARFLRRHGLDVEQTVGIFFEPGVEAIAAMLAVLKAGGCYLPLDPDYPVERLAFMLADSGAALILTSAALAARLPAAAAEIVLVDLDAWPEDDADLELTVRPEQAAYIIYTSGSTGVPKGVVIEHGSLTNYVTDAVSGLGLRAADRVLQFASLSFDVAVEEIFPTLAAGASVVIRRDLKNLDYAGFTTLIADAGITGCELPTHYWSEWMAALDAAGTKPPACLRYCVIGTERVKPDRLAIWQRFERQLFHVYGLTEATVTSLIYPFQDATAVLATDFNLPVGKPQANTRVYVLDASMRPLPVCVPGELYVGGDGLARGYHGQPALTAERFVSDPFAPGTGKRLYRTGDKVRWRADGNLEFLGRNDEQVKLRGFRIEPAEIEAALVHHPTVAEAAVTVYSDKAGDRRLVAYLVASGRSPASVSELRRFLSGRLPEHMIPEVFVLLAALPITANGKVDRRRLPEPRSERPVLETAYQAPKSVLERTIAAVFAEVLGVGHVGVHDNFFDLGGNSMRIVQVHARLRQRIDEPIALVDLFAQPTVSALATFYEQRLAARAGAGEAEVAAAMHTAADVFADTRVAVIGMVGRFSGSHNLEQFWRQIKQGDETIRFFSDAELRAGGVDPAILALPNFVPAKGVLEDATHFDAGLFDIPPREAELMDPQHRVFLEHVWMALEESGYDPAQYPGRIALYAGASPNYYSRENLLNNPACKSMDSMKIEFGNYSDFLPQRASYLLNLTGASVNVQSACSTSLTAVAEAYYAVLGGQCDIALAGGVSILFPQISGYLYQEGAIWSRDGHCRSFDQEASGLVIGEGVGIVALKRLSSALADGDNIYAVIRGAAITNEGASKVGFAAPGVAGQSLMIRQAIQMAGVNPRDIGLLEAHGSATRLGDPAEVAALTRAWRFYTQDKGYCALGSVKSNIGHADIAAGVAGFIKAALCLRDGVIPPSLHFKTPNPELALADSPFYVPKALQTWPPAPGPAGTARPRLAGVSSLGVGGTNAHVILEEAPASQPSTPAWPRQLLTLSAKTPTALERLRSDLADWLEAHPEANLTDVAYTLQVGRRALPHRRSMVVKDGPDAVAALRAKEGRWLHTGQLAARNRQTAPRVVFLFGDQGTEYMGMGGGLYDALPGFRASIDGCAEILKGVLTVDLRDLMYVKLGAGEALGVGGALQQLQNALPALLAVSYTMARQWMDWGVAPAEMIGYGLGEYTAACLSGVMSLRDALLLAEVRGRLLQSVPLDTVTMVALPADEVAALLTPGLAIAAVLSPRSCVVVGVPAEMTALEARLDARLADHHRMAMASARHPQHLAPLRAAFLHEVKQVRLRPPERPYVSGLTGAPITEAQAIEPTYWADQMIGPLRFAQAIGHVLAAADSPCLLEVSPGRALSTLARQQSDRKSAPMLLTSMRHAQEDQNDLGFLYNTLGRLWLAGVQPDWARLYTRVGEQRRRVVLPTYPFERQHLYVEPPMRDGSEAAAEHELLNLHDLPSPRLCKQPDLDQWFYLPAWRRTAAKPRLRAEDPRRCWLIFLDACGLGTRLGRHLTELGHQVVTVRAGAGFVELAPDSYVVASGCGEDFLLLCEELRETGRVPDVIVNAWGVTVPEGEDAVAQRFAGAQTLGIHAMLHLVRALDALQPDSCERPALFVITNNLHEVTGDEVIMAEKATLLGIGRVLPQETGRFCRCIDVLLPETASNWERLIHNLAADCASPGEETVIAYRGRYRYAEHYEPIRLGGDDEARTRLRPGGVYLITGGLGYLGFELGAQLVEKFGAKLALVGHRPLPARHTWDQYLAEHETTDDKTAWKIRWMRRLEERGAHVLPLVADVCDPAQMAAALAQTRSHFGGLHGIFHAAGITDERHYHPIKETDIDNLAFQFAPKIQGLLVLEELLKGKDLDFVVSFSSIAALLGGLGFVGYAAANNFLDAYTRALNRRYATHWLSVNWDGWLLEDLVEAARTAEPDSLLGLAQTLPEGLAVLLRLLARPDLSQVAVSSCSLALRVDRWVRLKSPKRSPAAPADRSASGVVAHARPHLSSTYHAPTNEVERVIAGLWQELLGLDKVGVHDNFFELGGDSLLAVHLSTRLRSALGIELNAATLLALQTVAEQAEASLTRMAEEAGAKVIAEISDDAA